VGAVTAWGAGIFRDDLASAFVAEIVQSDELAVLQRTFSWAGQAKGHLLYEPAVQVLIAAEVLAAVRGRPTRALPSEVARWVAGHPCEDGAEALRLLAIAAVERVKEDSEIAELWARSDEVGQWIGKVDDLLDRLNSPTG
jgi:hypothetical protein